MALGVRARLALVVGLVIILALCALFLVYADGQYPAWTQISNMPTARTDLSVQAIDGKLYAIGGRYDMSQLWKLIITDSAKVEVYVPAVDTWLYATPMSQPRFGAASAVITNEIYIVGGYTTSFNAAVVGLLEVYSPTANTWTVKVSMPTARSLAGAAAVDGKLYIIGGNVGPGSGPGFTSTVEMYDPLADSWEPKAPMPTARAGPCVAEVRGRIYAIGGHKNGDAGRTDYTTAVEVYYPITDTWEARSSAPSFRAYATCVSVEDRIYVVAGQEYPPGVGSFHSRKVEQYGPEADQWTTLSPFLIQRGGPAGVVLDGYIYVVGGQGNCWSMPPGDECQDESVKTVERGNLFITDTEPPTGTILLNGGAIDSTDRSVIVGLFLSDNVSGIHDVTLSNDGVSYSSWLTYVTSVPWQLLAGDEAKTVYVKARDWRDNERVFTDTIYLDTSAGQEFGVSINEGALFTNKVTVTLSLPATTYTAQMVVSNDGGFAGASWEPYATHREWQVTQYGSYVIPRTVYAKYKGTDGTISSTYQDDIILDVSPPTGSIDIVPVADGGANVGSTSGLRATSGYSYTTFLPFVLKGYSPPVSTRDVRLMLSAVDDVSGVSEMMIANEPSFTEVNWEAYATSKLWRVDKWGTTTVYVKYRDYAGNVSLVYSDTITF